MLEKLQEIISKELSINKEEIQLKTNLRDDLGVDSMDLFNLIAEIEKGFDIIIPDDVEANTIEDVIKSILNIKGIVLANM